MRGWGPLPVVLVLLVAGCASPAEPEDSSPGAAGGPVTVFSSVVEGGEHVASWSTSASIPSLALRVRFELEGVSDCVLSSAAAGRTNGQGVAYLRVLWRDLGRSWSAYTSSGPGQVVSGDLVDTRPLFDVQGDRWSGSHSYHGRGVSGNLTILLAGDRFEPNPQSQIAGSDSLRFRLACTGPFRVASLEAVQDPQFIDDRTMDAELGIALPMGHRLEGGSARLVSTHARSLFLAGHVDADGNLSVAHDGKQRSWELGDAERLLRVEGGRGDYEVRLDCTCVGSVWAAVIGLEELGSLAALDALVRA